jgi:hypothetical protein
VLEKVYEYRYAGRAAVPVFIEQRPHVVVHPPDPNRSRPILENVLVDQRIAATCRRVDLGRRGTANEAHFVGR